MIYDIFRISDDVDLDAERLKTFIKQNDEKPYDKLWDAYVNDYDIYHARKKPDWKPDNRCSVNFAKYIVRTFLGFSYGVPVKVESTDTSVQTIINDLNSRTCETDVINALAELTAIFGRSYRIVFVDEEGSIGTAAIDPREGFMIYDESIIPHPRYFCRAYYDSDHTRRGSVSDNYSVTYFHDEDGEIIWDESYPHGFGRVPACEVVMDQSRHGIFQDVLPLIDNFNKVLSEKSDDIEYFSDAYLQVLGATIDEDTIRFLRENRVINLAGRGASDVTVGFLERPSSDGTQENLLDRLEREIFTISMVCNISDKNFATSSGIALRYKLLPMVNLAASSWNWMARSLDAYYKLVCLSPVTSLREDDWQTLSYIHTLNYPANISDEVSDAAKLSGVVSKRTQLSTLSIIDDVDAELARIREDEEAEADLVTPYNRSSGVTVPSEEAGAAS